MGKLKTMNIVPEDNEKKKKEADFIQLGWNDNILFLKCLNPVWILFASGRTHNSD